MEQFALANCRTMGSVVLFATCGSLAVSIVVLYYDRNPLAFSNILRLILTVSSAALLSAATSPMTPSAALIIGGLVALASRQLPAKKYYSQCQDGKDNAILVQAGDNANISITAIDRPVDPSKP